MRRHVAGALLEPSVSCVLALRRQLAVAPLDGLAALLTAAAVRATSGDHGFALEIGPDRRGVACWAQPDMPVTDEAAMVDADLLATAIDSGAPVIRQTPPAVPAPGASGWQAIVPLVDGGCVVALVGVAGRPHDFGSDDLELLELLGDIWWDAVRRRRLEAEVAAVEDQLELVMASIPDGVVLVDQAGSVRLGNPAAHALFSVGRGELVGRSLVELVDPESLARAMPLLASACRERVGPFDLDLSAAGSHIRAIRATAGPWTDRTGRPCGTWAVLHNTTDELAEQQEVVAQLLSLNEELVQSARTDALTGLGNRLRLAEDLVALRAQTAAEQSAAALMVDLDLFKRFNDRYGHVAGDEALRAVAAAVKRSLRATDRVYRYGGEEILALLPGAPAHAARKAAERILRSVEALAIQHLDNPPSSVVTVSIGVSVFDLAHTTFELALREADAALYAAKGLGRNRWVALAA